MWAKAPKKFLQFTDNTNKKQPIVYGFGFDNEQQAKECLGVIQKLKDKLDTLKSEKLKAEAQNQAYPPPNTVTNVPAAVPAFREPLKQISLGERDSHDVKKELNKTAPAVVPNYNNNMNVTSSTIVSQHELTAHPDSFNNSNTNPLDNSLNTSKSMKQNPSPLPVTRENYSTISQRVQDQENLHQARAWQSENADLRSQLDKLQLERQELTKQLTEERERVHAFESEKGAVTKMIADQAIQIRENEQTIKDLRTRNEQLQQEQEKQAQVLQEVVHLRQIKNEHVPMLEEKIQEKEASCERYHKILTDFQERLRSELPESHFVWGGSIIFHQY